jgi:hypothetical protein
MVIRKSRSSDQVRSGGVQRDLLCHPGVERQFGLHLPCPCPELVQERDRARDLCQIINATREGDRELRRELILKIFGKGGDTAWVQPPFFCDYGSNIELGERVFFNFNCTVLDVCKVTIGDYCQFGSGVQILTPLHPLNAALRRKQEYGAPVTIGSDSPGRHYWFAHDRRCWKRGLAESSGRRARGRKSLQDSSRDQVERTARLAHAHQISTWKSSSVQEF